MFTPPHARDTRRKYNVAVVLSHFDLSGVTTNTIDLCEGLTNIGHRVTLIVGTPKEKHQQAKAEYVESKGIGIVLIPDLSGGILNKIKAFFALSNELIKGRYDVIHLESIYLSLIPRLLHKKFTVTLHSWGLKKNIFAPRATRIIAISRGMKDEAINRHGYREEDIDIVLHGVSPRFAEPIGDEERSRLKERYCIPEHKLIIGIVGSIQPRKGHHFLLEAVGRLGEELRERVHIVFCGNPTGPENDIWIENELAKHTLRNQVTRIGHTDPLNIYRCLDIFCLPSVWEGFPLVVVESMLAGNCVLRSNVQGADEQIVEGETGYTFKTEDVSDLKSKLEMLLRHPEIIDKVGRQSQDFALKHFTLNTMAENTVMVYRKILNNK